MIRRPPETLITTPESLHLMLSSRGGRSILGCIRTVIIDEIHAVVGSKRGTLLISAVDRLVMLGEEFQRIALSATVKPTGPVAAFVGGFMRDGDKADPVYIPRPVKRCRSSRQHHDRQPNDRIDVRIGRSGYGVTQTSHATFVATHAADGLTAAVLAEAVMARDIEPLRTIECPLDVLAHYQGVTDPGDSSASLAARLQPLTCLPLPAALWEAEVLPARLSNYDPYGLDRLMHESSLLWIGRQRHQVAFCHADDLDLMVGGNEDHPPDVDESDRPSFHVADLFPDHRGRYRLSALLGDPPRPGHQVLQQLWAGAWAGQVTNDSMDALRQLISRGYKITDRSSHGQTVGRGAMIRSRRTRSIGLGRRLNGSVGNWHLIVPPPSPESLVDRAEIVKDRVRRLLDRYGILFRQLLMRELPVFQWSAIFRSLRLMELSGEIVAGSFFNDVPGLQFASRRMLRLLHDRLPADRLYWINAVDPASICGLGLDALKGQLPRRSLSTHLVYLGSRLAMVSERQGKSLRIHLSFDDERLIDCFILFDHLLGRRCHARRSITIETINTEDAAGSPAVEVLRKRFDIIVETRTITVYRRPLS